MSKLELHDVHYSYPGGDRGVEDISFNIASSGVTAIVGASGCGKSTILKLIAGFLQPNQGRIVINDEVVASSKSSVAPQKRNVGLVFQNNTLLPHLTVEKNIAFGFPKRTKNKSEAIAALLRDFRIEKLRDRYPHEISGGEAQRVALARGLASDPSIFIMDEPFSSIDSVLRRELRQDAMTILRDKKRTVLIVTHDAEEAMELADQLVVVHDGRVLQTGSPRDVYYRPQHPQVAELFGEINHLSDPNLIKSLTGNEGRDILLRPESIELDDNGDGIAGRIIHIAYRGNYDMLSVIIKGQRCLKVKAYHHNHNIGDQVHLRTVDG